MDNKQKLNFNMDNLKSRHSFPPINYTEKPLSTGQVPESFEEEEYLDLEDLEVSLQELEKQVAELRELTQTNIAAIEKLKEDFDNSLDQLSQELVSYVAHFESKPKTATEEVIVENIPVFFGADLMSRINVFLKLRQETGISFTTRTQETLTVVVNKETDSKNSTEETSTKEEPEKQQTSEKRTKTKKSTQS